MKQIREATRRLKRHVPNAHHMHRSITAAASYPLTLQPLQATLVQLNSCALCCRRGCANRTLGRNQPRIHLKVRTSQRGRDGRIKLPATRVAGGWRGLAQTVGMVVSDLAAGGVLAGE